MGGKRTSLIVGWRPIEPFVEETQRLARGAVIHLRYDADDQSRCICQINAEIRNSIP